jgi:lysozyme family protein
LKAVREVLENEGGYVDDPHDKGGETKFGISKRSYPGLDIANLTKEQACEIYYRDWWLRYRYGEISNLELATELLDIAVNVGPKPAAMIMQRAVVSSMGEWLDVDGHLGDISLAAINSHPNQGWLLDRFKLLAIENYLKLRNDRFLAGWVRRALN